MFASTIMKGTKRNERKCSETKMLKQKGKSTLTFSSYAPASMQGNETRTESRAREREIAFLTSSALLLSPTASRTNVCESETTKRGKWKDVASKMNREEKNMRSFTSASSEEVGNKGTKLHTICGTGVDIWRFATWLQKNEGNGRPVSETSKKKRPIISCLQNAEELNGL